MEKFTNYLDNYFAELSHDCEEERAEILDFFHEKIHPVLSDHNVIGLDRSQQEIFHLCYDCHIPLWNDLFKLFLKVAKKCEVNLDWQEIKPFMRFSFISMKPEGQLPPHVGHYLPTLTAFNIPLCGSNHVEVFEKDPSGKVGASLGSWNYTHPIFLNVYKYHASKNLGSDDRLIMKVHLMCVPWDKLVQSYQSKEPPRIFDFNPPWKNQEQIPQKVL